MGRDRLPERLPASTIWIGAGGNQYLPVHEQPRQDITVGFGNGVQGCEGSKPDRGSGRRKPKPNPVRDAQVEALPPFYARQVRLSCQC